MNLFPDNEYSRIVHFTDPVADVPAAIFGFKHAGNEIWYFSPRMTDLRYSECINRPGQKENRSCSSTMLVRPFVDDHMKYLSE